MESYSSGLDENEEQQICIEALVTVRDFSSVADWSLASVAKSGRSPCGYHYLVAELQFGGSRVDTSRTAMCAVTYAIARIPVVDVGDASSSLESVKVEDRRRESGESPLGFSQRDAH